MKREERTCKFCGKTRNVINVTTYSGIDYDGRNCGSVYTTDNDAGCSCKLGQRAMEQESERWEDRLMLINYVNL